jgi:hypothetical protein
MEKRHSSSPCLKYYECKNPLQKFLPPFSGIKKASSSLIISQRAKLTKRSITNLCWWNWRTFWRKNVPHRWPRWSCFARNATAHRALATQKKLDYLVFNVLITHPILWIWPRRTTTSSLDWQTNWKITIFCTTWSLLPWRPGWRENLVYFFFLSGLQKL